MYHGGRRHHGRGHWRGGVWYPYVVGGYDYAPAYVEAVGFSAGERFRSNAD